MNRSGTPSLSGGLGLPGRRTLSFDSAGLTDTGRCRRVNQDAFLDAPELGLWAVADGMGGHQDGALASRRIVEGLRRPLPPGCALGTAARLVRQRLSAVNQDLLERAAALEGEGLIGSTLVSLIAVGAFGALLWAGDSRAYRLRDGRLSLRTQDHSQLQEMLEAGLITPEQMEGHPLASVLLRAVGGEEVLDVEGQIERLHPGDRWLLCSDGLYRELNDDALTATLSARGPAECARALIERALDAGGHDNITALVIDVRAAPASQRD